MNKKERLRVGRKIRYELAKGTHTYTMCSCGRSGCRSNKCWECWLEYLEEGKEELENKKSVTEKDNKINNSDKEDKK